MSAATPPTPASPRRSPSSGSRRDHGYSQSDNLNRSQSMVVRGHSPSAVPTRANSAQQTNGRPPSSSRQAQLASVARRDFEQSNLQQPPQPRRSASMERSSSQQREPTPSGNDQPTRSSTQRTSSRTRHSRLNSEMSANGPSANGDSANDSSRSSAPQQQQQQQPRRRTTVTAQTGQWQLGKTIGAGSMGKVKLARNNDTGETAAIKIVPRYSQDDHRSQQERERADHSKEVRTAREAAIVTLVNHPYICGMRDVVRTNYHWYMLFEYVNGGQMLDYIISHGRLKEKPARKFARQIASALDYCHRNSIVHRDLKIENILISKTGDIKIIDFGLSNLFSPRSHLKTFCGSLYFAAPELLQAKAYTGPEVDIWSFGIVLYVLVCGKVPFDDQSMPQLHAKIKRGAVEYPGWLSQECKHLISRMLVTDPRQRAPLSEIMNHPWMTKGFSSPVDNFLSHREPLQLPLDPKVIDKMTGFDFGSADFITRQLESTINSEDYQRAMRQATRKANSHTNDSDKKRSTVFDFYQRRKSASSRDALAAPSSDTLSLGEDPVNAFSPLISIYYLVREKQEREKMESNPGGLSIPHSPGQQPLPLPDLAAPPAAHTNSQTPEMVGEKPTGGRTRPRARTHGEDDVKETLQAPRPLELPPQSSPQPNAMKPQHSKRESTAAGIFRRFSTRRNRDSDSISEKPKVSAPPPVEVSAPESAAPPRQSMTIRKTRDQPPSAYANVAQNHPDLLAPPSSADSPSRKIKGLGRSTSVNSADLKRRFSRRGASESSALKSGAVSDNEGSSAPSSRKGKDSDQQSEDADFRSGYTGPRATSFTGTRRESMTRKRLQRKREDEHELPNEVPEETDQELAEDHVAGPKPGESQETLKPVYLKGLFSVSTTSNKPLAVIRRDIIRVLKQLGVEFAEMKSGFSCRYKPSIDTSPKQTGNNTPNLQHRRKISFAGLRSGERERDDSTEPPQRSPGVGRSGSRRGGPESSFASEDLSQDENEMNRTTSPRTAGETTTHVQGDYGNNMVLRFEILVVKVPLLSLHGLQFKKVDGGTWQYKKMADAILGELKL